MGGTALRSRRGASFRLLQLLRNERFEIALSVPLVLEYEGVLLRHARKLGIKVEEAVGVIDYLYQVGHRQDIHFLWRPALGDPREEFIQELAVAAHCAAIITYHTRDFTGAKPFAVHG